MIPIGQLSMWARPLVAASGIAAPLYTVTKHVLRLTRSYATEPAKEQEKMSSLYLADINARGQTSPAILGLLEYFERHVPRVGFFVPVAGHVRANSTLDTHVELVHRLSQSVWKDDVNLMQAFSRSETQQMISAGQINEFLDKIYEKYTEYRKSKEFVLVEGIGTYIGGTEVDAKIAAAIGAPVLMHITGEAGKTAMDYYNLAMVKRDVFTQAKVSVAGVMLNKIPRQQHAMLTEALRVKFEESGVAFAGAIPEDPTLATVRVADVSRSLNAELVFGNDSADERIFSRVLVASQQLEDLLDNLAHLPREHPLVVTTADRLDLILGLIAATRSKNAPNVAAIVLAQSGNTAKGGVGISEVGKRLLSGMDDVSNHGAPVGIIQVDKPLYNVVNEIANLKAGITAQSQRKVLQSRSLFERYIDLNATAQQLTQQKMREYLTPKLFQYNSFALCRAMPQHIVLPEGYEPRILAAAAEVVHNGVARITLLGDPDKVKVEALKQGLDISGCNIENPLDSKNFEKYVDAMVEARKHKELPRSVYADMLTNDPNTFGTMMVACGDADGMVSGAVHTTAATIRPALMVMRAPDATLVSSIFFMCLPDKVLVYGDCAVNPNPSSEDLAQIAISSADTAAAFGIEPRVAMLSYSTLGSGAGPEVKKVSDAVALVKQRRPDLAVEGPIQYDAAIDPTVAKVKVKTASEVAGKASVFIFPDLNTGNNTYKAVQQASGAIAVGPVMQGLRKPVNDLSRGCTVLDVVNTVAVTSVQALAANNKIKEAFQKAGIAMPGAAA